MILLTDKMRPAEGEGGTAIRLAKDVYIDTDYLERMGKKLVANINGVIQRWIPIKTRPMTVEERNDWEERTGYKLADEDAVFFDCRMPDDGEEILICSKYGRVSMDECVCDEYGIGLDVNGDWDGIVAWMPSPEPYKGGEQNG